MEKIYNETNNLSKLELDVTDIKAEIGNIYKNLNSSAKPKVELDEGCLMGIDGVEYLPFSPCENNLTTDKFTYVYGNYRYRKAINNRISSDRIYIMSYAPNNTEVYMKFEFILQAKDFEEETYGVLARVGFTNYATNNYDTLSFLKREYYKVSKTPKKYSFERYVKFYNPKINTFIVEVADLHDNVIFHDLKVTITGQNYTVFNDGTNMFSFLSQPAPIYKDMVTIITTLKDSLPKMELTTRYYVDALTNDVKQYCLDNCDIATPWSFTSDMAGITTPFDMHDFIVTGYNPCIATGQEFVWLGYCPKDDGYIIQLRHKAGYDTGFMKKLIKKRSGTPVGVVTMNYGTLNAFTTDKIYESPAFSYVIIERDRSRVAMKNTNLLSNEKLSLTYGGISNTLDVLNEFVIDNLPYREVRKMIGVKNSRLDVAFIVTTELGNYLYRNIPFEKYGQYSDPRVIKFDICENIGKDIILDAMLYNPNPIDADLDLFINLNKISLLVKKEDGVYYRRYNVLTKQYEDSDKFIGTYRKAFFAKGVKRAVMVPYIDENGVQKFKSIMFIDA